MAKFRLDIKTPELKETMYSRVEKPKVYRLKRKTFGVAEAAQNVIGGAAETAGNIADTKIGGLAGGLATGGAIQSALGIGLGPVGWLIGAGLGAAATRGIGKGLKSIGESVKTE
jgi:predicted phage tail protein